MSKPWLLSLQFLFLSLNVGAFETVQIEKEIESKAPQLLKLKNFRIDTHTMLSAGLPNEKELLALKTIGVTQVIDLIPGDRSEEASVLETIDMPYANIAVEWGEPTLQNFIDYVALMHSAGADKGSDALVLTHCKLNWRGAVFTYLYRVTQLRHDEELAKAHMYSTWKPNKRWLAFIKEVKTHYASD